MPRHSDVPQWADDLQATINHLHDHVIRLEKKVDHMSQAVLDKINELSGQVTVLKSASDSATTVITGIAQQILDAVAAAQAGDTTEAEALAKIAEISTTVQQEAKDLGDAVAANTPAAPPATP